MSDSSEQLSRLPALPKGYLTALELLPDSLERESTPDNVVLTDWPVCDIKDCDHEVVGYVYGNNIRLGLCDHHYVGHIAPDKWQSEKLNWLTRTWRKLFGWSGNAK